MAYDFNTLTKQADEASNRGKFYTDFEDVDPNVLHQISNLTKWIRTKGKGSDVREVIAQLFERTWLEGTKEGNSNMEVAQARGTFENLAERLQYADFANTDNEASIVQLEKQFNSLIANAGNGTVPSELLDIRNGNGGTVFATAGQAVRQLDNRILASLETKRIALPSFEEGKYIDYTSARVIGLDDVSIASVTSEYIDVSLYDSILISGLFASSDNSSGLVIFNREKQRIAGYPYSRFVDTTLILPKDAYYIKFSVPSASVAATRLFGFLKESKIIDGISNQLKNDKDTVTAFNVDFVEKSKNLFNAATVTRGVYVANNDGLLKTNSDFCASDFIEIFGGESYVKNYVNQGAFYDSTKSYISGFDGYSENTSPSKQVVIAPYNAKYVRFSLANKQVPLTQFENGSEVTEYEPHYLKIKSELFPSAYMLQSKNIADLLVEANQSIKIKLIGDSITHGVGGTGFAQDGVEIIKGKHWHVNTAGYCWANLLKKDLESRFNCTVTNFGCSGAASSDLVSGITELIKDDDDVVICQIGTNNRGDGSVQRFDYLASDLQIIYDYCATRNIKFIPMIAPPASQENESIKSQHMEDVAHVITAFAQKHNLEYINNFRNLSEYCELKDIAIDTLLMDGLHPSDKGYELMYRHITRELGLDPKIKQATW